MSTKLTSTGVAPLVTAPLVVLIAVLLVSGGAAVALHRKTTTTPLGFQRLVDPADHLSLAVPSDWQVPALTEGALTNRIETFKSTDPQVAPLADIALAVQRKVRLGVFAIDMGTRTSLFAYGADDPGLASVEQIPTPALVDQLVALGAKNVDATPVHLTIGDAKQVSLQLPVGTETISELIDYLVLHDRVVAVVLARRGAEPPSAALDRIESTLEAA